jgi:hypothetical protein
MRPLRFGVTILGLALALAACGEPEQFPVAMVLGTPAAGDSVRVVTGTVQHIDLEGGFYAIHGLDGVNYDPINLPDDYRRSGLSVTATVKIRPDLLSIHMYGTIVEILKIQPR